MMVYKEALSTASLLAIKGCVTEEVNQNLTDAQKILLRCHFRLGHLWMKAVQWIANNGWLGQAATVISSKSLDHPKCATCQFGKQSRTPAKAKGKVNKEQGELLKDQLRHGDRVFSDQYQSRVPGRAFTSRGGSKANNVYEGGTLF